MISKLIFKLQEELTCSNFINSHRQTQVKRNQEAKENKERIGSSNSGYKEFQTVVDFEKFSDQHLRLS
jgi:hypothetical protein